MSTDDEQSSRVSAIRGWLRRAGRPVGITTRGKTKSGRLRRADQFLSLAYPFTLRNLRAPMVDLGFGASPVTTLESLEYLRRHNPALRLIGVEIDPDRVRAALPYARPGLEFRLGGFNLPLEAGEMAGVIRAMNVLRQYSEEEYLASMAILGSCLAPTGILLEGTSDPPGNMLALNLYLRGKNHLLLDGLALMTNLRRPFLPRQLQAILPKNLIHHLAPGSPLDVFFGSWSTCWQRAVQTQMRDPRTLFAEAARWLFEQYGYRLSLRPGFLRRGILLLHSIPGEPRAPLALARRG
jgi:hypothetical protein